MAGEKQTGTSDVTFNLISVIYHALQAAETVQTYLDDARSEGDEELVECFEKAIEENEEIAERCKKLLGARLGQQEGEEESPGEQAESSAPSPQEPAPH